MILSSKIGALRGYRQAVEEQAMEDQALYRAYSLLAGTQDASRRMDIGQSDIARRQQQFEQAQQLERDKLAQMKELEGRRLDIEAQRYAQPDPYKQARLENIEQKNEYQNALRKAALYTLPIDDESIRKNIAELYAAGVSDDEVNKQVKNIMNQKIRTDDKYRIYRSLKDKFLKKDITPDEKRIIFETYKDNPMLLEYITGGEKGGSRRDEMFQKGVNEVKSLIKTSVVPIIFNPPLPVVPKKTPIA